MDGEDKTTQDALQDGQPSSGDQSPSASLEVLKEQVEKLADAKHSKLDQQINKLTKAEEAARKRAEDAEARLVQVQKEKDEAELEAAQGDPERLGVIQMQRKLREEKAEVERKTRELAEQEAKIKPLIDGATEFERKQTAQEIANQYGVDASVLIEHTDGSREKMESLAKVIAKSLPSPKVREDLKPDSAISSGGVAMPESAKDKIRLGWDKIHKP